MKNIELILMSKFTRILMLFMLLIVANAVEATGAKGDTGATGLKGIAGSAGQKKKNRDIYNDLARDSANATLAIQVDLLVLEGKNKDQIITVKEYFTEKNRLEIADFEQQVTYADKMLVVAQKTGDTAGISEAIDLKEKIRLTEDKRVVTNARAEKVDSRSEYLQNINNKYTRSSADISLEKQKLFSRYQSGLITEVGYIEETTKLKLKDIEATREHVKGLEAYPATEGKLDRQ